MKDHTLANIHYFSAINMPIRFDHKQMLHISDELKYLEAQRIPLPRIKWDDNTYLSWSDIFQALLVFSLWMILELITVYVFNLAI